MRLVGPLAILVSLGVIAHAGIRPHDPVPATHDPAPVLADQQLFLNDCGSGCSVKPGADDATTDTSAAAQNAANFSRFNWLPGEWAQVVQCVKEVYSPFHLTITDVRPVGQLYNEVIVAGSPAAVGLAPDIGGVVGSISCGGSTNAVAFAFAETGVATFAQEDDGNRVWGICWVIAQESAHLYGLSHEYSWTDDGSSSCNDPMTYRADCGGQKFFRNRSAMCGEFGPPHGCQCSNPQNSHALLLNVLGPGTPITPPPVVSLTTPADGAMITNGSAVHATASSVRGIGHVELWLNNHKWVSVPGVGFGAAGQPSSDYTLTLPNNVPDGVIDIVVKAFDDILLETDAPQIEVTKGAPCATASTCLKGQKCDAGKCYWDAPTGDLGATCDYNEFCVSGTCTETDQGGYCTTVCVVGATDACAAGFECVAQTATEGVCLPASRSNGGCCSVDRDGGHGWWLDVAGAFGVLAFVCRRRRRR